MLPHLFTVETRTGESYADEQQRLLGFEMEL
jgi:hypothetical protein